MLSTFFLLPVAGLNLNLLVTFLNLIGYQIITQFKEQGLNTKLYSRKKEMGETYSIVPTSAITYGSQILCSSLIFLVFLSLLQFLVLLELYDNFCVCDYFSGEGIPDLLLLLVNMAQRTMVEKLTYCNELQVCFIFTMLTIPPTLRQSNEIDKSDWDLILFASVLY